MSILKPVRVEEYILDELKSGPKENILLVESIQKKRPHTTKQAIYSALRKMKEEEIILSSKKVTSLHAIWLEKIEAYVEQARQSYSSVKNIGNFLNLEDGDKIRYSFQDSYKTDVFWTHAYYLLLEKLLPGEPVYLYNPHEWFLLTKPENEQALIRATTEKNHPFLIAVGGNNWLDKKIRSEFGGDMSQCHLLREPLFSGSYYCNVFGDFLVEVWIDKVVSQKIEDFYQTTSTWNSSDKERLEEILSQKGSTKLVISRNKKKADRIKASLRKYFAIKKTVN